MRYTFHFAPVWNRLGLLLQGAQTTLWLSLLVIVSGFAIGVLGAFASGSRLAPLRLAVRLYVELVRNTPLLAQLFFLYFGLPGLGVRLNSTTAALLAMSFNLGAYATEIVRGGIDGVPRGQTDAGSALGLTRVQIFLLVILKPALKIMFPALIGQFTLTMLATSIVSQIGVTELFHMGSIIDSDTYRSFESYAVVCGFYLVLAVVFRLIFAGVYWLLFAERVRRPGALDVVAP